MKRTALTLIAGIALVVPVAGQYSDDSIRANLNGHPIHFTDAKPMMVNGRVMVPIRDIFTYLGGQMEWNQTSRTLTARVGDKNIWLPINRYEARVNNIPVMLDQPARVIGGRTMVPLRFVSESLGANVDWIAAEQLVEITMMAADTRPNWPVEPNPNPGYTGMLTLMEGDVLPFRLDRRMTSKDARVGDRFSATLDSSIYADYRTLPEGMKLEGHVNQVRSKSGNVPGILDLTFDRLRMPNGQTYPLDAELISLDEKSVEPKDGRLVAKDSAKKNDMKWVGYGAGAGAIMALLTEGNLLSNSLIGAALGFLYGEIQKDPKKSNDVTLSEGTAFGVRLESPVTIRIATR